MAPSIESEITSIDLSALEDKPLAHEMLEQNLGKEASLDILRVFLGATAELVVELHTAIRKQHVKETASALRELGSSCTVVGANGVLEQCLRMEELLQNSDWCGLESNMAQLVKETRTVGQFINELLSQAIKGHFRR